MRIQERYSHLDTLFSLLNNNHLNERTFFIFFVTFSLFQEILPLNDKDFVQTH